MVLLQTPSRQFKAVKAQHYEKLWRTVTATQTAYKAVKTKAVEASEEVLRKEETVQNQSKKRKKGPTPTAALRPVQAVKKRKKKTRTVVKVGIPKKRTLSTNRRCSTVTVATNGSRWKNHPVHFVHYSNCTQDRGRWKLSYARNVARP